MFKLIKKDGGARFGLLTTKSGAVETPFFMAVATKLAVKHISSTDLKEMGNSAVISNAFILHLRPGEKEIKKLGGIKKLMNYSGINFTDSGGFQMYKEVFLMGTSDEGVVFRSPFDGSKHMITPEKDMEIQVSLGSDVAMCLDVMPNFHGVKKSEIEDAVHRTSIWAVRCKKSHDFLQKGIPEKNRQLLFGISQGGVYPDLRMKSINALLGLDFDGYSVGGMGMGEPKEAQYKIISLQRKFMPDEKPLYLMGIGSPVELLEAVERGADIFDSRFPTQNARRGTIFTSGGKLRLLRRQYALDKTPLDKKCSCFVCRNYSRAYIRYQLLQKEGVGFRLASFHNLYYLTKLMEQVRESIKNGNFKELKKRVVKAYEKAEKGVKCHRAKARSSLQIRPSVGSLLEN
jgi:queuine tRNA-ribosyltransferase